MSVLIKHPVGPTLAQCAIRGILAIEHQIPAVGNNVHAHSGNDSNTSKEKERGKAAMRTVLV